MDFSNDSKVFDGAYTISTMNGYAVMPWVYTDPKTEFMACRETAWLGVNLNMTPVFDVSGPDAVTFFNQTCTNKDFGPMVPGQSKHALVCNDDGYLLADGVVMKKEDGKFRTYWLAPILQFLMMKSGLDVQGEYVNDEYFFQVDGPKSLEILEEACQCDLHDIKFAKNKTVKCCGTDMVVHRLGMSGCLAYEVHGDAANVETIYAKLREVVLQYGGQLQGCLDYGIINHTPGGYPNQMQHYQYAYFDSGEEMAEFAKQYCMCFPSAGSAKEDPTAYYVTPYDIGWGYLVNFNHEFTGKDALVEAKAAQKKKPVTLEWNTEDVGVVFMSQFRGQDVEPYDPIDSPTTLEYATTCAVRGDYVQADGRNIGIATGRTYAYYERRMISLAFIETAYAVEGTEVTVLWGEPGHPQKEIRAKVAAFPYYNGEYRNETCDVDKLIPKRF